MARFCLGFWPREESTYGVRCFVEGPARHVVRDGSASPANVARSAQLIAPGLPVRACMHGVDEPSAALLAGWLDVRVCVCCGRRIGWRRANPAGNEVGGRARKDRPAPCRRLVSSRSHRMPEATHARRFTHQRASLIGIGVESENGSGGHGPARGPRAAGRCRLPGAGGARCSVSAREPGDGCLPLPLACCEEHSFLFLVLGLFPDLGLG
jgi:hypothetical protein